MKFVACADVHLDKKLFNIPDLFQDMFKYFEQAVNFAIEKKVDHFIMAGDVFDNNKPELETLERTRALINKLKNEKINVIGIVGDHDYNWLNPTYSWLKNVCAAEDSTSNNILTIDYKPNPKDVVDIINNTTNKDLEFIFIHQQVKELFPFCEEKKQISLNDINLKKHKKLKGIIMGDIHGHKSTRVHGIDIMYIGSLGYTSYTDALNTRNICYYDGNKVTIENLFPVREFIKIDLRKDDVVIPQKDKQYTAKPVFIVMIDDKSKSRIESIRYLYDIGYVRVIRTGKTKDEESQDLNIRASIKHNINYNAILKNLFDESVTSTTYDATIALLERPDETKAILDKYKEEALCK